jgi:hypothetical protein
MRYLVRMWYVLCSVTGLQAPSFASHVLYLNVKKDQETGDCQPKQAGTTPRSGSSDQCGVSEAKVG